MPCSFGVCQNYALPRQQRVPSWRSLAPLRRNVALSVATATLLRKTTKSDAKCRASDDECTARDE